MSKLFDELEKKKAGTTTNPLLLQKLEAEKNELDAKIAELTNQNLSLRESLNAVARDRQSIQLQLNLYKEMLSNMVKAYSDHVASIDSALNKK